MDSASLLHTFCILRLTDFQVVHMFQLEDYFLTSLFMRMIKEK